MLKQRSLMLLFEQRGHVLFPIFEVLICDLWLLSH